MIKVFVSLILLVTFTHGAEDSGFAGLTSYSIGMISASVTENESTLVQTDTTTEETSAEAAGSTSASAISFNLTYEFNLTQKQSYFLKATVPMMTSDGSSLFLGGVGMNWYFNELGSSYRLNIDGSDIVMIPKMRYWAGASLGLGYLIYNTESAKKTDLLFDLAFHVGAGYSLNDKWGLRAEAGFGRGTGVATTTMIMRIFAGTVYTL